MKRLRKLLFPVMLFCLLFFAAGVSEAASAQVDPIASAVRVSGGKWVTGTKGKRYQTSKGSYLKNKWIRVSGKVYRLDAKGYCETGWFTWKNQKYYAIKSGAVYHGRWVKLSGKYYYFAKNGALAVNQRAGQYYVDRSGVRVISSWVKKGGKLYYFGSTGKCVTNIWVRNQTGYRYLGSDGAVVTDQWVGKYYVGDDGFRLTNCEKDGYWLNEKGARTVKVFRGSYIFVGDSRMVGMYQTVAPGDTLFLAKVGCGYSWLSASAGVKLKYYLNANPKVKVVLAYGVNDLGNIDQYITYYQSLISLYPDTEFYIMSVNPVDDEYLKQNKPISYQWVNDTLICQFNKKMKTAFKKKYIDTYSYLKKQGFSSNDGVHYTEETYQKLYTYLISKIG